MKRCPDCETLYEDHVDTCLVDGADLEHTTMLEPSRVTLRTGSFSHLAVDTMAAVRPPVEEPPQRSRLPLIFAVGVAAVLLVGLGVVVGLTTTVGAAPPPAPVLAPPKTNLPDPAPLAVPEPEPEPAHAVFVLDTVPTAAKVTENGRVVCHTPCTIDHPPEAPLPRAFSLQHDGYTEQVYTVTKAGGEHQVSLAPLVARAPVPAPAQPRAKQRQRAVVRVAAPQPAPKKTTGAGRGGDLKNPFGR